MGWINNAKANEAGKHAREALAKGNHILVYKIIEATTNSRVTAPMAGIAEQIQAIEAEGWMLANMAAAEGKAMTSERTALVCLFRRR
ncbi:hypothetical protein DLE60_04665 [Micromonospora globispora]|uniref:DUF4177 domain-containing protein n=1 Tax=Micromonospora globispora TaxID=1450148 RepID=A0A317K4J3_9ACTN|nr:hypothetical protein [Micromonospora globispora]PWU48047.1 hypothetical protein DLJ46_12920 [Micromonospora globispora]PWU61634.1 hypothetical protein DLE60_04665 [Micromonospora globispora]RQW94855.1 hypothetical protein DKL51_15510 [Micromonospora globispora]